MPANGFSQEIAKSHILSAWAGAVVGGEGYSLEFAFAKPGLGRSGEVVYPDLLPPLLAWTYLGV